MSDYRILPRYRHDHQHEERTLGRHIRRHGTHAPPPPTNVKAGAGMHADTIRLRGIPVVGGACGTSPGTDPYYGTERRMMPRSTIAA